MAIWPTCYFDPGIANYRIIIVTQVSYFQSAECILAPLKCLIYIWIKQWCVWRLWSGDECNLLKVGKRPEKRKNMRRTREEKMRSDAPEEWASLVAYAEPIVNSYNHIRCIAITHRSIQLARNILSVSWETNTNMCGRYHNDAHRTFEILNLISCFKHTIPCRTYANVFYTRFCQVSLISDADIHNIRVTGTIGWQWAYICIGEQEKTLFWLN